jgi:cytochrome b6-f complex iron-sulfur subunit
VRGVRRYVEDLLEGRRPRRFRADAGSAEEIRAAIALRAAQPGAGEPDEEFLSGLHERLTEQLGGATAAPAGARPTRRRFVQAAGVAVAGGVIGAGIDHLVAGPGGVAAAPADTGPLQPNTGVWRDVAATDELPEGGVRAFDVGTLVGFVERTGGRVRAVSGVCTHQGCRLALEAATRELACPCHRTVFAVSGTVVRSQLRTPPATLPRLPVRELDGRVQVYAPPTPT